MRVTKYVEVSECVDIDLGLDDIAELFEREIRKPKDAVEMIRLIKIGLKSIPDHLIDELDPEDCREVADALTAHIERFSTMSLLKVA